MFVLIFCTNWKTHKENSKDDTFEYFCGILIINQQKLLEKEIFVVKIKLTCLREREISITARKRMV
jgi:hypothetical protein